MYSGTPFGLSILFNLVAVAVFGHILRSLWTYWRRPYSSVLARVRGPPTKHWFFGFLTPSEAKSLSMSPKMLQLCDDFDDIWYATFTNRRPTLDPEAISYVLNDSQTYVRTKAQTNVTRLIFGDGLATVDGEQHRMQRKVIGPAFTARAVEGMAPVFYEKAQALADGWAHKLRNIAGQETRSMEINAYQEFEALSLDIIGTAGFQYDFHSLSGHRSELEDAFVNVTKSAATGSSYSTLRSHFPWVGMLGSFLSQEQKTLDKHKRQIWRVSKDLFENAKREMQIQGSQRTTESGCRDILSLLVESNTRATAKDRLGDKEIISMVPTLLSGGYDNNASEMSYALFALTNFPETQRRLRQELLSPPPNGRDWHKDLRSLERLPYLDAVAKETFRLYSSAHSIPRTAARDDCIPVSKNIQLRDGSWVNKIRIGRDDDVVIAQKWVNVASRFWGPTAHVFRPERWIEDTKHEHYEELPGWSHLMTFSIGPRNCPGYRMAVAEFKVGLAVLVSRFDFVRHEAMDEVYGEVQIVDRPRVKGREGYYMPCWVKSLE
ncbi:cytochrome P450 [Ilyonectria robusta]|uniref:cytochrome P450 n=1 Tax=Ilyonectria robusta TaxID=1079257 RepID=UPI001E8E1751|nr:cytochrome P450 [Ilyonectria robusta]KAH8685006.1 cytochrome P450 [Ilyonectria robusta]